MDSQSLYSLPFLCVLFFCCFPYTTSMISFFFPDFSPNDNNIIVSGTATKAQVDEHPSIRLTDNVDNVGDNQYFSIGRAYYYKPIPLWDPVANVITNFTTTFEFVIRTRNGESLWSHSGGGIAFFITSEDSVDAPTESIGGWMGLFNSTTDGKSSSKMVAVEFDTWNDTIWEDDPSNNHVGIDVNSIVSEVSRPYDLTQRDGDDILMATVSYDGTSEILSVFLKHLDHPYLPLNLTHNVKLRDVLPEKVMMGFSAATGGGVPVQAIRSWSFSSTLDLGSTQNGGKGNSKMWLVGLITGLVLLVSGVGFGTYILWRNSKRKKVEEDEDLIEGTGPKMFAYKDLVVATNNFSEEGKLGQGGFGGVYKGFWAKMNMEIAVKKISSNSRQGKKEYISEVITISRLRHRNLVQLVGLSHEQEFVVVYEYMPNGSLDSHLFGKRSHLSWPRRSKIVHGLASGLLYLHEEWEQCVVHRDIKSSNVMLDSNFNAKLGDFGLARFVDHGLGSQTTDLAGTRGYIAPESVMTSKFSKESDVFSFGMVALEIACGRKVVEPKVEESKISLLNWVWELYGEGRLLEAVDETLNGDYDMDEMKCLMTIGLWCAHPDHTLRPSIRQAIKVLNYEAPLPSLLSKMPMPLYNYYAPGTMTADQIQFFCTSKESSTSATKDDSRV
nr:L-type lectin-domain containing receptor kinase IX.1-like [Quercus suber]